MISGKGSFTGRDSVFTGRAKKKKSKETVEKRERERRERRKNSVPVQKPTKGGLEYPERCIQVKRSRRNRLLSKRARERGQSAQREEERTERTRKTERDKERRKENPREKKCWKLGRNVEESYVHQD